MKVALLSNINTDSISRMLKKNSGIDVFESSGYGNELGMLINKESALSKFCAERIFLIIDIMEVIGRRLDLNDANTAIEQWFRVFEGAIDNQSVYYVSDAYLYAKELDIEEPSLIKSDLESLWNQRLKKTVDEHANVRLFSFCRLVEKFGEQNAFSAKMWYLGKIPYTVSFQKLIVNEIDRVLLTETSDTKKVLLLDLDNTLWKGLAGENDKERIVLSDDGLGCAYKDFQRVLLEIKKTGVILGIVSKNNYDDALSIINNHPHMILREDDFSAFMINWENKNENIVQICKELNVGTDSVVFIDDSPTERQLVSEMLPEVTVPDFPSLAEDLPDFAISVYKKYFKKNSITSEDLNKTQQYIENRKRAEFLKESISFSEFLEGLNINLIRVEANLHFDRILQLVNKTNQFNLTTKRYTEQDLYADLNDENKEFFVYRVTDRFGDNGVVVVVVVKYGKNAEIEEFTMSCRVMGRNIENAVIEDVENSARKKGCSEIKGIYIPTEKNKPVKSFYSDLGYTVMSENSDRTEYNLNLDKDFERDYRLSRVV